MNIEVFCVKIYNNGMKRNFLILLFLLFCCAACASSNPPSFESDDTTLQIISDPHYLGKELMDESRNYDEVLLANDGRTVQYASLVFDKTIDKALEINPHYFIITGDLSYNGEKASHLELAQKLKRLYDRGIQPLVIPGNHDIFNLNAKNYKSIPYQKTDYITDSEFKEIYRYYGYEGAYSYDSNSLSYIFQTANDEWLIMLDTALYSFNLEEGFPLISGYFMSLEWLENNLKYAQAHNIKCYVFSHHNLFNHNPLFDYLYEIGNSESLIELYHKYDITLHFSGHLHIQDIVKQDDIYDVTTGSLVDYGNRYGILKINQSGFYYNSYSLDFLMESGQNFSDYSRELFYSLGYDQFYYGANFIEDLAKRKIYAEFIAEVNTLYFNGEISYNYYSLKQSQGYQIAKESLSDFTKSYVNQMIECGNRETHTLYQYY